jgi:hypothetical protein
MGNGRNEETLAREQKSPAKSAADRALAERPRVSIRFRIAVIMTLSFLLTAGITVAWVVSVQEFGMSQQLLEHVNRYLLGADTTLWLRINK